MTYCAHCGEKRPSHARWSWCWKHETPWGRATPLLFCDACWPGHRHESVAVAVTDSKEGGGG